MGERRARPSKSTSVCTSCQEESLGTDALPTGQFLWECHILQVSYGFSESTPRAQRSRMDHSFHTSHSPPSLNRLSQRHGPLRTSRTLSSSTSSPRSLSS